MRLERVKRWQWILVALVVGLALAWARRVDEDLPSRLGEGVADRNWFEREVQRRVTLADGSTVPAFGRLTVYPLTIPERGGRRSVHVVAGMYLAEVKDAAEDKSSSAVGKLRPFFFIAPVPYQSLADARAGPPAHTDSTVRTYLDGLRGNGVSYTYAWWAEARYATTAWVGGSIVVIGLLWPTLLNLLVYGRFLAPPRERGVSLWNVKPAARKPKPHDAVVQPDHGLPIVPLGIATATDLPPAAESPATVAPRPAPLVLSASSEDETHMTAADHHKEFGAKRDDFYPTELKANSKTPA